MAPGGAVSSVSSVHQGTPSRRGLRPEPEGSVQLRGGVRCTEVVGRTEVGQLWPVPAGFCQRFDTLARTNIGLNQWHDLGRARNSLLPLRP